MEGKPVNQQLAAQRFKTTVSRVRRHIRIGACKPNPCSLSIGVWCIVSNRVLVLLFLALLSALSVSAQSIEARFSTEKTDYLVGEPIFVTLAVSNKTSEAIWLDFKGTGFPFPCND